MKPIKTLLAVPAALLAMGIMSAQAEIDDDMSARLAPVGKVCIQGQNCAGIPGAAVPATTNAVVATETAAPEATADTASNGRKPEEIYNMLCHTCHATGLLEAPKFGDTAAWSKRAEEQGGLDGLLARSITGYNAMPPKGTCMNCSDEELKATIRYMSGL